MVFIHYVFEAFCFSNILIERSKQISNQKPLLSTWYIINLKYYFLKKQSHQSELRLKSSSISLFKVKLWDKNVVLSKNYFIFSLVNDKNLYTDINSVLSTSAKETERYYINNIMFCRMLCNFSKDLFLREILILFFLVSTPIDISSNNLIVYQI